MTNPAATALLDNNAKSSSPPGQGVEAWDRRKARLELRYGLNRVSTIERVRKCGRCSRTPGGTVEIRLRDGIGGYAGLVSCGSVWVCPVCNAKIAQRRVLELGTLTAAAHNRGYAIAFLTHTVRHHQGDRLTDLLDGLKAGWGRMTSGKHYKAQRQVAGIVGHARSLEVTHGLNGWHPHFHSLWFGSDLHGVDSLEAFAMPMWERFDRAVQKAGLASTIAAANDWQHVTDEADDLDRVAQYLQKMADPFGIGFEMTTTQSKMARKRHGTEPHWSLLPGAINGETPDVWLWHEFEKATRGQKQLTRSQKLADLLGVDLLDQADEDIAAEEMGTQDDALVVLTAEGWSVLIRDLAKMTHALKIAPLGQQFLSDWLTSHGIEHWRNP